MKLHSRLTNKWLRLMPCWLRTLATLGEASGWGEHSNYYCLPRLISIIFFKKKADPSLIQCREIRAQPSCQQAKTEILSILTKVTVTEGRTTLLKLMYYTTDVWSDSDKWLSYPPTLFIETLIGVHSIGSPHLRSTQSPPGILKLG